MLHQRGELKGRQQGRIRILREVIDGTEDETKLRTLLRAAIQCASLEAFAEVL